MDGKAKPSTKRMFPKERWNCPRFFSNSLKTLLLGCLFAGSLSFSDAHAKDVFVEVNQPSSTLQYTITLVDMIAERDIPSNNYRIRGQVEVSNQGMANNTYISVNATRIAMTRSNETFYINLKGNIGSNPPSVEPIKVNFRKGSGALRIADIDIIGDLDESTISVETTNGSYSGTLTITAIIL